MNYPDPIVVIHNEISDTPGSFAAVWDLTGGQLGMFSSAQMISNKTNPHSSTHKLTLKEAIRIQQALQSSRIAESVAGAMGGLFVPHCSPTSTSEQCVMSLLLRIGKHGAAIGPMVDEALDDDYLDPKERKDINEEITRLETKLADLKLRINRKFEAAEPGAFYITDGELTKQTPSKDYGGNR